VLHLDKNREVVCIEVHNYSKLDEKRAQVNKQSFKASIQDETVIGELDWVIISAITKETLDAGYTNVLLKDVEIEFTDSPMIRKLTRKRFLLTDEFALSVCSRLQENPDFSGFALTGEKINVRTFSWDWFDIDSPTHATKRQERGELGLVIANPSKEWEVIKIEFLTDVSVRIKKFGEDAEDKTVDWRINIRRGSHITLPSVIDGKVVSN
jgi:hypothetical protein